MKSKFFVTVLAIGFASSYASAGREISPELNKYIVHYNGCADLVHDAFHGIDQKFMSQDLKIQMIKSCAEGESAKVSEVSNDQVQLNNDSKTAVEN